MLKIISEFLNFLAKIPEFWKNSDGTPIWKVRMVRSLADRTFQLRPSPAPQPLTESDLAERVCFDSNWPGLELVDRKTSHRSSICLKWSLFSATILDLMLLRVDSLKEHRFFICFAFFSSGLFISTYHLFRGNALSKKIIQWKTNSKHQYLVLKFRVARGWEHRPLH